MSKAAQYLETCSIAEGYGGDTIETVTINEALTACKIHELDILQAAFEPNTALDINTRITQLQKELRNIKLK